MKNTLSYTHFILFFMSIGYSITWCEENNEISLNSNDNFCNRSGWTVTYNYDDYYFTFKHYCCSFQTMIFRENETDKYTIRNFTFQNPFNLKALYIQEKNENVRIYFVDSGRPENFFISFGCFNNENSCRTTIGEKWRPTIQLKSQSIVLFSDIDQRFWIKIYRTITQIAYLFIDGYVMQSVNLEFETAQYVGDPYTNGRYLFTGKSKEESVTFKNSEFTPYVKSVCERNGYNRILYFGKTEINVYANLINTTCYCNAENENITLDNVNTFPDCRYNSSLFDLNLTTIGENKSESENINIYVNVTQWFSIIFKPNRKYILNGLENNENTINFDTLEILENENIIFNLNCNISTLKITSIGKFYFKKNLIINTQILISETNLTNKILFALDGDFSEVKTSLLSKCGKRVYLTKSEYNMCLCNYTEMVYGNP
ncbi:hypothetical protein EIN_451420 [Entamoeba invadens IP1]|uniref:Uncharacterized protein n=1 Tax=Entamoeba invadens IP1 TaxID=370355 RepID=A0A0A1UFD8_ENTIV|nr:hypothetical protein EIN_451420 [Entamoeba invadens IP1]ELP91531.1 hypothetical protein EIN_451420 [Entamoeba invadens IP1]|eukprot:XP_004258302.1 hypothetical protein EIN_451420 [Entamoeba invadens IP1]